MAYESPAPAFLSAARRRDDIVDVLIAERAPKLAASAAWPLVRPIFYALLDYAKARRMADAVAPMGGRAALDFVAALLSVKVETTGLERIPRQGRLIAVSNHPTGIADGVAVFEALKAVRPEMMFYANADAHRVAPRLSEVLIPVEWVEEKRTRERTRLTLTMTRLAMEQERALVVFPAGRLARRVAAGGAVDLPWAPSAFSVARKYAAPVLPMHLRGPWPTLFHLFDGVSSELRDMTLFHELLNKRGKTFRLTIGHPIEPGRLAPDAGDAAQALQTFVERDLAADPQARFS